MKHLSLLLLTLPLLMLGGCTTAPQEEAWHSAQGWKYTEVWDMGSCVRDSSALAPLPFLVRQDTVWFQGAYLQYLIDSLQPKDIKIVLSDNDHNDRRLDLERDVDDNYIFCALRPTPDSQLKPTDYICLQLSISLELGSDPTCYKITHIDFPIQRETNVAETETKSDSVAATVVSDTLQTAQTAQAE